MRILILIFQATLMLTTFHFLRLLANCAPALTPPYGVSTKRKPTKILGNSAFSLIIEGGKSTISLLLI